MDGLHLDDLKIDSMVDLLKAAYTLEDYNRMIEIAEKLHLLASTLHSRQKQSLDAGMKYVYLEGKRHIIYYFGFSELMKGIALEKTGRFEEAKQSIQNYANLSWLDDKSEEAANEIRIFKMFAEANMLAINVLEGKSESIEKYVQFLDNARVEELLPGLMTILNSGIIHGFSVDSVLNHFEDKITEAINISNNKGESIYIAKFLHRLSMYKLKMGDRKLAIHNLLKALVTSDTLNDVTIFRKCVAMFETLRDDADEDQQQRYAAVMNKMFKEDLKNEKGAFVDGDCVKPY